MQNTTEKKGNNPFNAAQSEISQANRKNLRDLSESRIGSGK
jgi:hypothetical protein